jgi:mRNA-degrading endonuclease HigB of HigAB toxin-antitoxin module
MNDLIHGKKNKNNRLNPAKKARMTNLIQEKSKNYWLKPNQIKTQLMNKETNRI